MKTDSEEFRKLMAKWSREAFSEETQRDLDEYEEHKANYKLDTQPS